MQIACCACAQLIALGGVVSSYGQNVLVDVPLERFQLQWALGRLRITGRVAGRVNGGGGGGVAMNSSGIRLAALDSFGTERLAH